MGEALPLIISAASTAFAPALSAGIASVFGVAAGTLTNVVAGALLGAATSALMGGDPLTGALFGGLGGGVGSLFGGGADAAEGAAGAAGVADDAGASMLTESLSPAELVSSAGGGVGPPSTTAYDAVRSSLTQGSENILGVGDNVFSEGLLPEGNTFASGLAESTDPFKLAQTGGQAQAPGFLDQIMSQDSLGDMLAGGGNYLMRQGLVEDQAKAQGEELRETAEFKNQLAHQGKTEAGQAGWMRNAISNMYGTRAESLARGYSGRYSGSTSQATQQPLYQQGTLFERTA